MSEKEISEPEKIKLKFDAIWKARDSELAAVRERTLLAWGFLMFCYGGYGYLVSRILLHEGPVAELRLAPLNIVLLFLALVCWRLSAYWVQLAKGAKAWAENSDYIAEAFQHVFLPLKHPTRTCPRNLFASTRALNDIHSQRDCRSCQGDVSHVCIFSLIPADVSNPNLDYFPDFDQCHLTTKGGAFSPAKIMIAIARLSLCISLLLVCVHTVLCFLGFDKAKIILQHIHWQYSVPIALLCIFFICPIIRLFIKNCSTKKILKILVENTGTASMGLHHEIQARRFWEGK